MDILNIVGAVKYTWDSDSIVIQNLDKFAGILCDIFPIDKDMAKRVVSKANEWASENYSTPNWSISRGFVMDTDRKEEWTQRISTNILKFGNSPVNENIAIS